LPKQKGVEVPFLLTDSQSSYNTVCNFSRRLSVRYCSCIFHSRIFSAPNTRCRAPWSWIFCKGSKWP